jgi:ribose transport system ATP-binding protein
MPTLETVRLTRRYGEFTALRDISLRFAAGEIHGIAGENGAGKSTLMKVLSGVLPPSEGQLSLEGTALRLSGVRDALAHGIVMIHQELNLVDDLTVAENIALGFEPIQNGFLNRRQMAGEAEARLRQVGAKFSSSAPVGSLSIAEKQLVEIAKALSREAQILIMDEPTAVLSQTETDALHGLVRELAAGGKTVLYISHKLVDLVQTCDSISVLRDGEFVKTVLARETNPAEIAEMMVGRPLEDIYPDKTPAPVGEAVITVRGLQVPGRVHEVSFTARKGEVLGFGGLIGAGRTEMAEAIAGLRPRSGEVLAAGRIAYVSEDRKGRGLVLDMTVTENLTLASLAGCWLNQAREAGTATEWVEKMGIRAGNLNGAVRSLSGGNQQKVAIAKWLDTKPDVLILDEPTRGVDVGAKREIYRLIADLAAQGLTCLVISSEMPELIGLCHRVLILREGRIAGEITGEEITEGEMMRLALGIESGGKGLDSRE